MRTGSWGVRFRPARRTKESTQLAAQERTPLESEERKVLIRSLARFLYCSRRGRGGSGRASCGWGNIRSSFQSCLESAQGQAERRFVAFEIVVQVGTAL